ncbi:hypothetical protein K3495_g5116 [Podosphaera aphanis]|nr:hypothetical protein K3495_g5116 [Podosphaera aphanis]
MRRREKSVATVRTYANEMFEDVKDSVEHMAILKSRSKSRFIFTYNDEKYKQELEEKWAFLQRKWTKGMDGRVVLYFDLEVNQFDVTEAFSHADLDEDVEINIHYPDGFKVSGLMLRVMKAHMVNQYLSEFVTTTQSKHSQTSD